MFGIGGFQVVNRTDLSIIVPGFRPHRWIEVYNTALQSCTRYSFEIIFVGPYPPPEELKDNPQIKYIEDWGTPTRCTQIGSIHSVGKLLARTDDDSVFFLDGLNQALDLYKNVCGEKDIEILRYREGIDFSGQELPPIYWQAKTHFPKLKDMKVLKKANDYIFGKLFAFEEMHINEDWMVCMLPLISKQYFMDLGGYDCIFEHLSFSAHDLCYRAQRDGGKLHLSPTEITNIEHQGAGHPEHLPIEQSHFENDYPVFAAMYHNAGCSNRIKIDFDNWRNSPEVWTRRFTNGKKK